MLYAAYNKPNFICRDTHRLKMRGWKKIFYTNTNQKCTKETILISDKIAFKSKNIKIDKVGHDIMINWSTWQEDIAIINVYVPNTGAPRHIKHILI